jgi:hypothetical protein
MSKLTIWDFADECGNVGVADVARAYGVDAQTVRKWIDARLLPVRRVPLGRKIIIKADDVDWFDAHHMRGAADRTA